MSDHVKVGADDLKTIRKALRCPVKLIKSDAEKVFLQETKERLEVFQERIFLSEKQLSWLHKIAARTDGERKQEGEPRQAHLEPSSDLPSYDELAGE